MSEDDCALVSLVIVVGIVIGAVFMGMVINSRDENYFQTDAIAHGYAHYELDHTFHWNNEKKKE